METNSKKLTKKELRQIFWRSCQLDISWNFERQQNLGYSYAMTPVADKLHEDNPEKRKRALKRGLEFMAITPQVSTMVMGINAALEEENANNPDFDDNSINAVKTSLMGPLAGIGDSLIPGTLRIIVTGISIGFCMAGSILGPILFLLLYNIPGMFIRWFCLKKGYAFGTEFISRAEKTNIMDKVSTAAAIIGLMVIGGMISPNFIWFELPLTIGSGDFAEPLANYLNQILPNIIPLALFLIIYFLLGKKIKTTTILLTIIIVSIAVCFIAGLF
jgi:fructoselysine and glucoselysine-specific PTS system IID component